MTEKEKEIICKKAIETWGTESQLRMLQEESTELSLAAGKMCRYPDSVSTYLDLAEEIADVEIMIPQMDIIFPGLRKIISDFKSQKLKRLKQRLATYENENKKESENDSVPEVPAL